MIPYGRQHITADDEAAVLAALRSDWITQGPAIRASSRRWPRAWARASA